MPFSCKFILGEHKNAMGMHRLYLQVIIDRKRSIYPMEFYLKPEEFDERRQVIKKHPNAKDYEAEMFNALAKANSIASRYRQQDKLLTVEDFRKEFKDPSAHADLIKFMIEEAELKRPTLAQSTYEQHLLLIRKVKAFRSTINFNHVNAELVQKFRNTLIADGNGEATIEKMLKILKHYLAQARMKGISVPFLKIRIKTFKSNRNALTEHELQKIHRYFTSPDVKPNHHRVLQYFLFSCYTGIRISDIKTLRWENIDDQYVTFLPQKSKKKNQIIKVPLIAVNRQYLPPYTFDKDTVFKCFTEYASRRILKIIAHELNIKKNVTYHTSRHTFGSLLASQNVVATQKIMGHSSIQTTMEYVHTNPTQLTEAMVARFERDPKLQE